MNRIESTFGSVRRGTATTRGCVSRETELVMAFRLDQKAEKTLIYLNASQLIKKTIAVFTYIDGLETYRIAAWLAIS